MNTNQEYHYAQGTYQTGSTCPPKSRGGIVALILVLVILVCGISTLLEFFNIPLSLPLIDPQTENTPFSITRSSTDTPSENIPFSLGFSGQEVPEVWCLHQDLPHGIYITNVENQTDAAMQGVLPGDILLQVDGQDITSTEQLTSLLEENQQPVQVSLYRAGEEIHLTLTPLDS